MEQIFGGELPSTSKSGWVFATHENGPFIDEPSDDNDIIEAGKWMLFYPKSEMDKRWIDICELFYFGELGIVNMMQASTFQQNSYQNGVIVCHIARTKKGLILETGRLIMNAMKYQDTMFYKTTQQTRETWNATLLGEDTSDFRKHTLQVSPQYQCPFDDATCLGA
jgi:hypothetical protein